MAIFENFKALSASVKPWIPAYQLLLKMRESADCQFILKSQIEMELIEQMPAVARFTERIGGSDIINFATEAQLLTDTSLLS